MTGDKSFFSVDPRGDLQLSIKVIPRASADRVEGIEGAYLKVRITAPPVEGKANRHLMRVLADFLSLRTHQLSLLAGEGSRFKRIRVAGLTPESRNLLLTKLSGEKASP